MFQQFYNPSPFMAGQTVNVDTKSFCQTLTAEEMESLKQTTEEFTLGITNRDKLISICMHRDLNGKNTLVSDPTTGEVKCLICGETFQLVDRCKEEDIQNAVDNLLDILQTTKTLYVDMPSDAARNFYTIIALIKKIPGLYKISTDNFSKHENAMTSAWGFQGANNMLGEYNALAYGFNPMMGGMGFGMQQPMMGAPMQPQMGGQVYGQQMMAGGNPFGFGGTPVQPNAPQINPTYAPQMNGYAYNPTAPAAPATPAADAPKAEDVTVNATFQA